MTPTIHHTKTFVSDAAALIKGAAHQAIKDRGIFRLALSGGNTPRPVYEAMASSQFGMAASDWVNWEVTFSDERCVPPTSEQSNFRMASEALLDHVAIPTENVLRMRGEAIPEQAAADYEEQLRSRAATAHYRHDLILLGMGEDGHTASLFPDTSALRVTDRLVVSNFVPKLGTQRLTFTYPLLNAARHVCFLVNSTGKENILEEVFSGKSTYPCAAVQPTDGQLTWLLGTGA